MSAKTGEAGQPRLIAKRAATLAVGAVIAAATSMGLAATTSAVKLIGVSAAGNAVLIEASEPVAYSVARPNPLTLTIDMRNVTVADARNEVRRQGPIAGVRVEQANAADGREIARVHLDLSGPSEYKVRSARNMIRVEFTPSASAPARGATSGITSKPAAPAPAPMKPAAVREEPAPVRSRTIVPATAIERVQSRRLDGSTIITLSGDGHLAPARVTESDTSPRRLILDFPNVISRAPSQTEIGGVVKKVRVALNSHRPVVTRVVMEIEPTTAYRVERTGEEGRDLAVVFSQSETQSAVLVAPPEEPVSAPQPEAPITLEQAMANVSAITPAAPASPADPMGALKLVAPPVTRTPNAVTRPRAERSPATAVQAPPATASTPRVLAPQGPSQSPTSPVGQPPAAPPSPATPSAPGPIAPQTIGGAQKTYTGHPISLDFTGGDLRTVLRLFAEVSGLNMIIDPDVQGSVDIVLTDVPWDQ